MVRSAPLLILSRQRRNAARGFTLVEILIALAVLAIALTAVLRAMGQAIDITSDLRERTMALWVAQERATEHQLKRDWPALDTKEGIVEFGGREWQWRERVSSTPVAELRRVDIEVSLPKTTHVLGRVSVFLRQP